MLVRRILGRVAGAMLVALLAAGMVGCDPGKSAAPAGKTAEKSHDDHDHHDHGDLAIGTFAESTGTLRKFHDQIKTAFEANKPDDAHDALHEIGHVLEALEKQVETLPADKQEAGKQAVKGLFDGYGAIDKAMHDGGEVKYSELGDALSKNVATLEASK